MRTSRLVAAGLLVLSLMAVQALTKRNNLRVGNGLWVGAASERTADNQVTRTLGGSLTWDFGSVTTTCEDSTGITVTGALAGDPCMAGVDLAGANGIDAGALEDGGFDPSNGTDFNNLSLSCYVSASDTVKLRLCPGGTAANPTDAGYWVRVISSQ